MEKVEKGGKEKMSGWISTGTMVDTLPIGQSAECNISDMTVTKTEDEQILINISDDIKIPLSMNFKTARVKWRIIEG
jgi:hypothetical protein